MQTIDFSEITILSECYSDRYVTEYYEKYKGKNCILTIPNHQCSWNFDVTFE